MKSKTTNISVNDILIQLINDKLKLKEENRKLKNKLKEYERSLV